MGKTLADLQSNISISAQNAVTGTLLWVDDYTGFSGDPAEQSGNYIALKISAEALGEELEGATITATYNGRTVTLDSDQIIIVRQAEGEDSITFTANKEGYTEGRLTLDFSGLTLQEPIPELNITSAMQDVTIVPTIYNPVKGANGEVEYNTAQSKNLLVVSTNFSHVPADRGYHKLAIYDSTDTLITESPVYATADLPSVFGFEVKDTDVGTGKFVKIVWLSGETSQAVNATTDIITIRNDFLTLEGPPEQLNVTLNAPATGVSISPSTVASNGTLNLSGNWGTVSGLTTDDWIFMNFETTFSVIDNWNYDAEVGYIDASVFDHWGTSVSIDSQGIVSFNIGFDFMQLADAIKYSYLSTITLDHYEYDSSTGMYERAHRLTINLDYSNLTYPNQTGIHDAPVTINNNSVNNFELVGELPCNVDSQKYELGFEIATLGTNLSNYNYIIYDDNGQDLTGHFSGNRYNFNNFTPALQATGPFVLKTQAVNEQAEWVDVCPPITIDVSQITFGPSLSYMINGTALNLTPTTGIPTGNGDFWASDSMRIVTLDSNNHSGTSADPYVMNAEVILTPNPGTDTWFVGFIDTTDTITNVSVDNDSPTSGTAYISGGDTVIGFVPTTNILPATVKLTYTTSSATTKHITCFVTALGAPTPQYTINGTILTLDPTTNIPVYISNETSYAVASGSMIEVTLDSSGTNVGTQSNPYLLTAKVIKTDIPAATTRNTWFVGFTDSRITSGTYSLLSVNVVETSAGMGVVSPYSGTKDTIGFVPNGSPATAEALPKQFTVEVMIKDNSWNQITYYVSVNVQEYT